VDPDPHTSTLPMHRFVTMQKKHGILTSRIRGWRATSSLVQVFQIRVHIVQRPGSCLVIINIIINVKIRIFRGTINLLATPFPPPLPISTSNFDPASFGALLLHGNVIEHEKRMTIRLDLASSKPPVRHQNQNLPILPLSSLCVI
jgi:hypothetical protein